jgi:hypothetical protein
MCPACEARFACKIPARVYDPYEIGAGGQEASRDLVAKGGTLSPLRWRIRTLVS